MHGSYLDAEDHGRAIIRSLFRDRVTSFRAFTGVAQHYQELFECGNGEVLLSMLCAKVALPSRQSAWSNAVKSGVGYRVKCVADIKDLVHNAVDK